MSAVKSLPLLRLDPRRLAAAVRRAAAEKSLAALRRRVEAIRRTFAEGAGGTGDRESAGGAPAFEIRADVLLGALDQALEARTMERARHYLGRLKMMTAEARCGAGSDLNLNRWKEYDDLLTDSLWILDRRDSSGVHIGNYWGNFVPQIPHQMIRRFTRKGEVVLDPFLGSGTTLIECRRLGRRGLGVEIQKDVAAKARALIRRQAAPEAVETEVVVADSARYDFSEGLRRIGRRSAQLLLMHPPYWDIIRFSRSKRDLSNAATLEAFLRMFGEVLDRCTAVLDPGRRLALVIGDKYAKGEWIPLGFRAMEEVLRRPYRLKSIVVKNFDETKGKRSQRDLWRYRALAGGFYVFKHEYVFLFEKRKAKGG